jgi:uncharacterized protein (TIGR00255 family)
MLKSMTGFGRAEQQVGEKVVVVEIKSLNGKQLEINTKIPSLLKAYELDMRNLLQQNLVRGTVEISINLKQNGASRPMTINTDLAKQYYQSVVQIADELQLPKEDLLAIIMKLPEVVAQQSDMLPEDEWAGVEKLVREAIADLDAHRLDEGNELEKDLVQRIDNIMDLLEKVKTFEGSRMDRIRERINTSLEDIIGKDKIDTNRFEQELVYYIEKIDFSEEKMRLANHCRYFKELLSESDFSKGKKLGFVLQEVGREINTLGSKANDADIQKLVVVMKDELEKAKEQVLNAL